MNARRFELVPRDDRTLAEASNRLLSANHIEGANASDWPSLDIQLWEQACASVAELRENGFFCVGATFDFVDPNLLWSFLTYSYGNLQFGSQALVEWGSKFPELNQTLGGNVLSSTDIRQFRRNNRKMLTLSLEGYFKKTSSSVVQRLRRTCGLSEWDLAESSVLEAIRSDVGEVDY